MFRYREGGIVPCSHPVDGLGGAIDKVHVHDRSDVGQGCRARRTDLATI